MSTMQVCELDGILQEQLQIMATTLKPATIKYYRTQANGFLRYLHRNYPQIISPAQIQRHPHIVGWLRMLSPKKNGPRYERLGGSGELIFSVMPAAVFEPLAAHCVIS